MSVLASFKERLATVSIINGYTVIIFLFVVWMAFFDTHNMIRQFKLKRTIQSIEMEIADYEKKYEQAVVDRKNLEANKEKYAREHHNFSKEGEQIFIIQ